MHRCLGSAGGFPRGKQPEFPSGTINSVQSLTIWNVGGHEGRFGRDILLVFSTGGLCKQFWHGQGCPLFGVVHPAFPLPTTALPTLQGALKDGFGEAVVACDIPKPFKFRSLDCCNKRFLFGQNLFNQSGRQYNPARKAREVVTMFGLQAKA